MSILTSPVMGRVAAAAIALMRDTKIYSEGQRPCSVGEELFQ